MAGDQEQRLETGRQIQMEAVAFAWVATLEMGWMWH